MKFEMKLGFFIALLLALVTSCSGDKSSKQEPVKASKEELKSAIKIMEDSLKMLQTTNEPIENVQRTEFINRLLAYFHAYPEDKYSAKCLDKVHMIYSSSGNYEMSISYADTLLLKYPKYENRAMILESQGSNFDIFATPRDSSKVRYYYELLLKENPKLDAEKKTGIKDRLANNHLTFDEYINKKIKDLSIK